MCSHVAWYMVPIFSVIIKTKWRCQFLNWWMYKGWIWWFFKFLDLCVYSRILWLSNFFQSRVLCLTYSRSIVFSWIFLVLHPYIRDNDWDDHDLLCCQGRYWEITHLPIPNTTEKSNDDMRATCPLPWLSICSMKITWYTPTVIDTP